MTCGGLPAMHDLVRGVGLPELIDEQLGILKRARPYRDSDHILNIAYNVLCGGHVLDDIEVRRNDAAFLDMLGAEAIPDPTTAGDFCRRFDGEATWAAHAHRQRDALDGLEAEPARPGEGDRAHRRRRVDRAHARRVQAGDGPVATRACGDTTRC